MAIKLWEWLDPGRIWIQANWLEWGQGQAANFFLRPPTLTASNFVALWLTDPKFLAFKDLNLLKKHIKNQEASSISWWFFPSQSDLIYIGNLATMPFHLILTVLTFGFQKVCCVYNGRIIKLLFRNFYSLNYNHTVQNFKKSTIKLCSNIFQSHDIISVKMWFRAKVHQHPRS